MTKHLQNVSDFLAHFEETHPLNSHPESFDDWAQAVLEAWSDHDLPDSELLEQLLDLRKDLHLASFTQQKSIDTSDADLAKPWTWLLGEPQIPQRTEEWYREKQNILTASEIEAIWKGPRTRAALIMAKTKEPTMFLGPPQLATSRGQTNPMQWGIRYEPLVKDIIEKKFSCHVAELGRIRHRTVDRLAASPDGLFLDGPYAGRLLEIKCPVTREIKEDAVPRGYWMQMQIQMEVCNVDLCEYVEVKFVEAPESELEGLITLQTESETQETRYLYHGTDELPQTSQNWVTVETYGWRVGQYRQITVQRDREWFQKEALPAIADFWKTVEEARSGTWQPPPPRVKKASALGVQPTPSTTCAIVDEEIGRSAHVEQEQQVSLPTEQPDISSYTDGGTREELVLSPGL